MVYHSCVRSTLLYGSDMAILKRAERTIVRSMCGVKLVNRKNMEELMKMLGLKETLKGDRSMDM